MQKEITRQPVNSSNIKSIGHDGESNTLQVEFHTGAIYNYQPVTPDAYNEMQKDESVGSWFGKNIRSNPLITTTQIKEKNPK